MSRSEMLSMERLTVPMYSRNSRTACSYPSRDAGLMLRLLVSQSSSQSLSRIERIESRPGQRKVSLRSSLIRSVVIVPLRRSSSARCFASANF